MKAKKFVSLLLCLIMVITVQIPVFASENPEKFCDDEPIQIVTIGKEEMQNNLNNSLLLGTVDLGNGLECSIYRENTISLFDY